MNLKEELKNLKMIKADSDFKVALRLKMLEKIGGEIFISQVKPISMWRAIFMRKAALVPIALIVAILGTGIGGAFASQSALPGDALYLVKLLTEDVRVALKFNPESKANLEMSFATKRLEEIKKVLEEKGVDARGLDIADERLKRNILRAAEIIESKKSKNNEMREIAKDKLEQVKNKKRKLEEEIKEKRGEKWNGLKALNKEKGKKPTQEIIKEEFKESDNEINKNRGRLVE